MSENKNHSKMRLSEQLPTHSADPATWNRLSEKLDALDAEAVYKEKLQQLPVHSPNQALWSAINMRLNRAYYFKTGVRIALSAAAGLLLFFTVSRISESYNTSVPESQVAVQQSTTHKEAAAKQVKPATASKIQSLIEQPIQTRASAVHTSISALPKNRKSSGAKMIKSRILLPTNPTTGNDQAVAIQLQLIVPEYTAIFTTLIDSLINQDVALLMPDEKTSETPVLATNIRKSSFPIQDFLHTPIDFKGAEATKGSGNATQSASVKPHAPADDETGSKGNNFGVAMAYLPENIYNGTSNSVFHNVDVTASYNKPKVRFNTSVGMAYNEQQFEINMSYDVKSPVTLANPSGYLDTVSYNSASLQSDFVGTEKHQYFTYNLGIGRRIFSVGKFSTWFNAGAGFGVLLNNPDLVTASENSIKTQYNAKITNVTSNNPVYNDVNINFVTGIDFSYKFLNKLSLSFTPTSRWYFKPVLSKNNQATDEMSLGFKTGLKFDF